MSVPPRLCRRKGPADELRQVASADADDPAEAVAGESSLPAPPPQCHRADVQLSRDLLRRQHLVVVAHTSPPPRFDAAPPQVLLDVATTQPDRPRRRPCRVSLFAGT